MKINKIMKGIAILTLVIFSALLMSCLKERKVTHYEATQELRKFESVEELIEYIEKATMAANYYYYSPFGYRHRVFKGARAAGPAIAEARGKTNNMLGVDQGTDYSQTNIQVKGVDEADFVKNDGKYIYILSGNNLIIVDGFPAVDAEILSKTRIEGQPQNIFVNDDMLVVFSTYYDTIFQIPEYEHAPQPRSTQRTHAFVYDISDREKPSLVKDINLTGQFYQARMIDNYVYFITRDYVYNYSNFINLPEVKAGDKLVVSPEIFYFDNPETNFVFHTIVSFNIKTARNIKSKSFLMGQSNNLYVSQENIYISYQINLPYAYYRFSSQERFDHVVVPMLPYITRYKIAQIRDEKEVSSFNKWRKISSTLEKLYSSMDRDAKEELIQKIARAMEEYEIKLEAERRKTVIQKIAIDEGNIEYVAKGEVEGYLLNQFSLDEYGNNLRVATTTRAWTRRGSHQYNNVFVLGGNMDVIGKLREIAPDERIYSTRFMGDRLYMVTFRQVDPLFVIDLSDPGHPEILGELKIPGFSDYLHPFDEHHIIGIGKETDSNQWGGVSVKGVKLSLFDVSDVKNPKQLYKYEIGESGTDSEALREHKAFLFDRKKNILVLPITEVTRGKKQGGNHWQSIWQGAYVLGLTTEDGFTLKGTISHYKGDGNSQHSWSGPYTVRRSLYINKVLYTISAKKIMMNNLDDIYDKINEVELS